MSLYLKKFSTHAEYDTYIASEDKVLPNVSICEDALDVVYYNPYVIETRVVAKFNVTSTSSPTTIVYKTSGFSAIEIDGVEQPSVVSAYTFSTTGEHTVKYTLTDPTSIGEYAFYFCYDITNITIPNSVTNIGMAAFGYCRSLTSIDIPSSVTSIDSDVFNNCSGLTSIGSMGSGASVEIPSGVTSIGNSAFAYCKGFTSITIPDSITSIGANAFQYCTSLTSITIPNSVTRIGNNAFYYCSSLTSMAVDSNNTVYDSRNNCNAIISTLTNTLIAGCKNTIIPNSVTSIGDGAFSSCTGLTSIDIPSGVTSIGDSAFKYCSSLTSITSNAKTAPTIEFNTFQSVKTGGTLYVPLDSSGYDEWMARVNYYLGKYNWTRSELEVIIW